LQIDKLVAEVLYFEREVYAARLTTSIKVFLVFGAGALGLLIQELITMIYEMP